MDNSHDEKFLIKGTPINLLKVKQIEKEIRRRGGKIPTNSVKESIVIQLREMLKEEMNRNQQLHQQNNNQYQQTTQQYQQSNVNKNGKRTLEKDSIVSPNKKSSSGDPKALLLEKKILNGFNFYPIVERLKFDELGFRLVKEYTRFIVVKVLTDDIDSVKTIPPPLIGRIWISHILDTNRYEELCKLIDLKIHHNPDGIEEVTQEEKRKRYEKTMELYEKFFTRNTMDVDIWEDKYLLGNEDDEDYEDDEDDYEEDDEEFENKIQQQLPQQPIQTPQPLPQPKQPAVQPKIDVVNTASTSTSTATASSSGSNASSTSTAVDNSSINISTANATPSKPSNLSSSPSSSSSSSSSVPTTPLNTSVNLPNTPSTPATPAASTTTTTPKSSSKSGEAKISIGFIYVKNQKKEITTFHGVGLSKTLFKVIKAYAKLKLINIPTTKFLYNGKPIMNETPLELEMKDGENITVVTA